MTWALRSPKFRGTQPPEHLKLERSRDRVGKPGLLAGEEGVPRTGRQAASLRLALHPPSEPLSGCASSGFGRQGSRLGRPAPPPRRSISAGRFRRRWWVSGGQVIPVTAGRSVGIGNAYGKENAFPATGLAAFSFSGFPDLECPLQSELPSRQLTQASPWQFS